MIKLEREKWKIIHTFAVALPRVPHSSPTCICCRVCTNKSWQNQNTPVLRFGEGRKCLFLFKNSPLLMTSLFVKISQGIMSFLGLGRRESACFLFKNSSILMTSLFVKYLRARCHSWVWRAEKVLVSFHELPPFTDIPENTSGRKSFLSVQVFFLGRTIYKFKVIFSPWLRRGASVVRRHIEFENRVGISVRSQVAF